MYFQTGVEVDETVLDQLLEDLTDFSSANGNTSLTAKLRSLQNNTDDDYGFIRKRSATEVIARVYRIIRVLETFGREHLERELTPVVEAIEDENQRESTASRNEEALKKVFVVHGHDNAVLFRVKETLTVLGLTPIVLREQSNNGRTIIEKFERFSDVNFAVVLMTADDMGGSLKEIEAGKTSARARQNVVMELGYFIAKLTRDKVCVLKGQGVEVPSDIMGVVYTPIDENEAWRMELARELSGAGYSIDLNRLIQN